MSRHSEKLPSKIRWAGVLALTLTLTSTAPVTASDTCPMAVDRAAVSNSRETVMPPGERFCYATDLPAGGDWLLDAGTDNLALSELRLEILGPTCEFGKAATGSFRVRHRSAAAALVEIREPGRHLFCVAARDPQRRVDGFRLTTAFSSWPSKGNPDEDEPDPDPIVEPGGKPRWLTAEPAPASAAANAASRHLCGRLLADDHGDVAGCATDLVPGPPLAAVLGNTHGDPRSADPRDDVDFFRLAVHDWVTVAVETRGAVDTVGGLYGPQGHRLAADDDGGRGVNFRLVETLGPGEYFVRVEGRGGATGPYRLRVAAVDRR